MSFCYAEKVSYETESGCLESAHVLCDTKIDIGGAFKSNWNTETRNNLKRYGLAKTIIIDSRTCLSFAGNDIALVHKLLEWLEKNGPCDLENFVNKAFEVHVDSDDLNDIELLILAKEDDDELVEIISIKEGQISRNCDSAWIGSYDAFRYLQSVRHSKNEAEEITTSDFCDVIWGCNDETVGGFPLEVRFYGDHFEYSCGLFTQISKPQVVKPGENVVLIGNAEDGGFTISFCDCGREPLLSFAQNNTSILYTRKYRYCDLDSYNPATKYLLLPFPVDLRTVQCSDSQASSIQKAAANPKTAIRILGK